jgi:two-component sensor histidine kinase
MRNLAATRDIQVMLPTRQDQPADCKIDEISLLREMHHRMANTLTLLTAQLWNEFRSSMEPKVRRSLARCEARITAFGRLHRLLAVGVVSRPVEVRAYVEELCRLLSEAVLTPVGVRCQVSADEGVIPSGQCERLGLIITELVTNAAKHAFTGIDGGLVRVEVKSRSGRWLCTVSDNGKGIEMPLTNSGTRILDDIARTIGGTLFLRSAANGTSVTVTFSC